MHCIYNAYKVSQIQSFYVKWNFTDILVENCVGEESTDTV